MESIRIIQLCKPADDAIGLFLAIIGDIPVIESVQPYEPLIDEFLNVEWWRLGMQHLGMQQTNGHKNCEKYQLKMFHRGLLRM
jgi:hypothetical protein